MTEKATATLSINDECLSGIGAMNVQAGRCLVVIPVLGKMEYTHALIPDLLAQQNLLDILIVDNKGDYSPLANERVVRMDSNIGWAAASNLGFRVAFSDGYSHAMTLNNDTRISSRFMTGILDTRLPEDAGVIAPTYDNVRIHRQQLSEYLGPAALYRPVHRCRRTAAVDGCALAITKAAWQSIGDLDVRSFGVYGWGADIDLCYRARLAGFGVYVTESSYLNHFSQITGDSAPDYEDRAWRDCQAGFERVYGPDWMQQVGLDPDGGFPVHALDLTSTR
jgi:GT2 family glycosyltransferase